MIERVRRDVDPCRGSSWRQVVRGQMFLEQRAFLLAVQEGSLAAAARRLGLSSAQASQLVTALETRLETKLLTRTTRRLKLTHSGQRLSDDLEAILGALDEVESVVFGRSRASNGTLRVAAPTAFARKHLAPHLRGFLDAHSDIGFHVDLFDEAVRPCEGQFDFALVIGVPDLADDRVIRLAPVRERLCASPQYIEQFGRPGSVSELRRHRLLAAGDRPIWRITRSGVTEEIVVSSLIRTNSDDVARELVRAGAGISLAPTWDIHSDLGDGRLEVLLPEYGASSDVELFGLRSPRLANDELIRRFIRFVEELYAGVPYWERTGASVRRAVGETILVNDQGSPMPANERQC